MQILMFGQKCFRLFKIEAIKLFCLFVYRIEKAKRMLWVDYCIFFKRNVIGLTHIGLLGNGVHYVHIFNQTKIGHGICLSAFQCGCETRNCILSFFTNTEGAQYDEYVE